MIVEEHAKELESTPVRAVDYLNHLVVDPDVVEDYLERDKLFDNDCLVEIAFQFGDIFLAQVDFDAILRSFFTENAWIEV